MNYTSDKFNKKTCLNSITSKLITTFKSQPKYRAEKSEGTWEPGSRNQELGNQEPGRKMTKKVQNESNF